MFPIVEDLTDSFLGIVETIEKKTFHLKYTELMNMVTENGSAVNGESISK